MRPGSAPGNSMKLSPHPIDGRHQPHGCTIAVRRVEGPEAREIFFHCQPPVEVKDASRQADDLEALLYQQGRRHGTVRPSAHADGNTHTRSPIRIVDDKAVNGDTAMKVERRVVTKKERKDRKGQKKRRTRKRELRGRGRNRGSSK